GVPSTATNASGSTQSFSSTCPLAAPSGLAITDVAAPRLPACTSQADIQTAYTAWVAGFSFSGGCSTTANIDAIPALPADAHCAGANLAFTYTATDDCGTTQSCSSTFAVDAPPALAVTCAPAQSLPACTSQADIQTAYTAWVAGFSFSGGCSTTANIDAIPALPADAHCAGANLAFTYTATDDCG